MGRRISSPLLREIVGPSKALRQAFALHAQGRLNEADRLYQLALAGEARNYDALYRLGLLRLQQARFGSAADLFRLALKVERRSADAHYHLAIALAGLNRHEEAIEIYEKTLAIKPGHSEAHNNLAHSLQAIGRIGEAIANYEKALAIKPGNVEARNNLAVLLQTLGRHEEAIPHYRTVLAARPEFAVARKNLANGLLALGRQQEATECYEQALQLNPEDIEARIALGEMLLQLDQPQEAKPHFEKVLALNPANLAARKGLGRAAHLLGRFEEAIGHYQAAIAIEPKDAEAHSRLGTALWIEGRLKEAAAAAEAAVALSPKTVAYYYNLASRKRFAQGDPHLSAMRAFLPQAGSLSEREQILLHFALGKAYGDLGAHREAFDHLAKANALVRRGLVYDEAKTLAVFDGMRQIFTASFINERRGLGDPSEIPVFIIGLPRSGTSLIEQILASHPQVYGAGELKTMPALAEQVTGLQETLAAQVSAALSGERLRRLGADYLAAVRPLAPAAERITDKLPGNFILAGLIHLAFPNARIIHACRDICDSAFSCFSILFNRGQHAYSYELSELGRYCRAYGEIMAHWYKVMPGVILDVHYEDVVAGLESQARRIIAHCGLEWDDACLDFYQTRRSVRTASASQVRQPIYRGSVGRWRPYEAQLQPFLKALAGEADRNSK